MAGMAFWSPDITSLNLLKSPYCGIDKSLPRVCSLLKILGKIKIARGSGTQL